MKKLLILVVTVLISSCTSLKVSRQDDSVKETNYQYFGKRIALLKDSYSTATGTLFSSSPQGSLILTNAHFCDAETGLMEAIVNNQKYKPFGMQISKKSDLCMLYLKEDLLYEVKIKDYNIYLFKKIFIAGYPGGYRPTIKEGHLSYGSNEKFTEDQPCSFEDFQKNTCPKKGYKTVTYSEFLIYTSIPVIGGSSGSPVFDEEYNFIGIINSANYQHGGSYMIPLSSVLKFLNTELKTLPLIRLNQ